ncbi:MAG: type III secretion system gatekeeper subunit SctW [Chlamydiales bacterium]
MSDSMPINLSAVQTRQAKQDIGKSIIARQLETEERFTEECERGFNPAAAEREQGRYSRFRTIESRRKQPTSETGRIKEVEAKTEEDLAHSFERRNPELPADKLTSLKNSLREEMTAEEIYNNVNETFDDPTLADEALDYLDRATTGVLQGKVRKARDMLNELKGREIIAGRNIDTAAKSYHRQGAGSSPTELRNLYREVTGDPKEHNALFQQLSEQYAFDDLKLLVAFLLQSLAYDLKSKGPSIQQAELQLLMTEARNLQSILWVYLFFKSRMKLIKSLYKRYGLDHDKKLEFEELAKGFIQIVEDRYPSMIKILRQADKLGLTDEEEKVIVLMQFRDAVRQLSPRLYKSMRHKQDVLVAIIEALEELEEEEEEEE